jgi:hypothetical protein
VTGLNVSYVGKATLRTAEGVEISASDGFAIVARESIEPVGMASLRRAVSEMWARDLVVLDALIADVPQRDLNPERVYFADLDSVRLTSFGDELEVVFGTGHDVDDPDDYREWIPRVLSPLLDRRRASLVEVGVDVADSTDSMIVARIRPAWRGKTVGDALRVGREAHALVKAVNGGALDLQTTADLVRTGYAHVLVDQPEGPWLDGKRSVALQTDKQKMGLPASMWTR